MKYIVILLILSISISFGFAQDDSSFITRPLPKKWSIKKEVNTIEKSLDNYDPLIKSLEKANKDLQDDLALYLKNPGDQVLAAKITMKMSRYAQKIVKNVDTIVSDQDVLLSVFSTLNKKLEKFSGYLDFKVSNLDTQVKKYKQQADSMKKELKDLAKKWKDEEDPDKKAKYKQQFRSLYNKYNIKTDRKSVV